MEAALRTVYEVVTGKELAKLEFESVRGLEGVKEATVDLDGLPVRSRSCSRPWQCQKSNG